MEWNQSTKVKILSGKFIELRLLNHLLSWGFVMTLKWCWKLMPPKCPEIPRWAHLQLWIFWPKEEAAEPIELEFYMIWLAGLSAAPSGLSWDAAWLKNLHPHWQYGRGGGGLGESSRSKGETEVIWIFTSHSLHSSNVTVNKSEYSMNELQKFFFSYWKGQPDCFTLASCGFSTQI